jgi:hypothetical protein
MAIVISTISVPWISRMDSFTPYLSITLLTPSLLEQGHFRQRANTIIDNYYSNIFLPMDTWITRRTNLCGFTWAIPYHRQPVPLIQTRKTLTPQGFQKY